MDENQNQAAPVAPEAAEAPKAAVAPEPKPVVPSIGEVPEDKPEAPAENEPGPVTYEATGDAGLDYALNFVGNLGYGPEHPAIRAAESGNFDLIRAELAAKGVKGADQVVALAENAFKTFSEKSEQTAAQLQATAEQAAGGKENWNLVRTWASANADPHEKQAVNAALAQGGFIAEAVVKQLVALYEQSNTLPKDAADAARPTAAPKAGTAAEPLTASAYTQAVRELYSKLGSRAESSTEYADLAARRLAAKAAGY